MNQVIDVLRQWASILEDQTLTKDTAKQIGLVGVENGKLFAKPIPERVISSQKSPTA